MSEVLPELIGARLQRIDAPTKGLFSLGFYRPGHGRGYLLLALRGGELGWVEERPVGDQANADVMRLRKHLLNSRVERVREDSQGIVITLFKGGRAAELAFDASQPALWLSLGEERTLAWTGPCSKRSDAALVTDWEGLQKCGPALVARYRFGETDSTRRALVRSIKRRTKQLQRRLEHIEADLQRADESESLRKQATLLLAHAHAIPKGARRVTLRDWDFHASDAPSPGEVEISIGEGRSPAQQAEVLYRQAKRLSRGASVAVERTRITRDEQDELAALLAEAREAASPAELESVEAELVRRGIHHRRSEKHPSQSAAPRAPYRAFRASDGSTIMVGRSSRDNDQLTFRVARGSDLWLHARGAPGSHVVVRPPPSGSSVSGEALVDAATLAAHFSRLKGDANPDVQYAKRSQLRRVRGGAPGQVVVHNERVIALRWEPTRLERLLRSEIKQN